jgi:two-component system NarL family sensor kinase
LAREAIDECHRISFELSPPSLKELGIIQAIKEVITHFSKHIGVNVVFQASLNSKNLTTEQELTFFRILQESLNNIQKHASAKRVRVMLYEEDGNVLFSIEDDGCGFNMQDIDRIELRESMRGLGLVSMRERVSNLNGQFEIVSNISEGTKVLVAVPLQKG